jgi:hypothetical protein
VTPEYIASKLSQLPQFKVEFIDHELEKYGRGTTLLGKFSEPVLSTEQLVHFYLPDLRNIRGKLLASPEGDCVRLVYDADPEPEITESELLTEYLAYCGGNFKQRVELALDPTINWTEQRVPPEASLEKVRFQDEDGQTHFIHLERFGGGSLPEGSTIVELDWNHKHCSFCWERIESGEIGYVGNVRPEREDWGKDWVCTWCYRNAVEPHDLRPLLIPRTART